ncbi:MAG: glycosyltransferase family 2 protein [Brevinematia bacterium]
MKSVSIIYVNYKTKDITLASIKSVIENTRDIDYEIILVDNNSGDGIVEEVNRLFPQVITIQSDTNLGFAGGCNLGVSQSSGKYILFLNTDTLLKENSIKVVYDFMEKNPNYGAVGVLLTDEEGRVVQSWGDFLPFRIGVKEFLLKPFLPKKMREKLNHKATDYEEFEKSFFCDREVVEVDYIIGADMFVRRDVFYEVGKFDERFFMFFEEADLQIRMRRKNYKVGIIRGTRIIHLESKSFKVSNAKRTMKMVSFLKYLRKHFPGYYVLFKPFSLIYGFAKLMMDVVLAKEYSVSENITFIKSLIFESFDFVKK